MRRSFSITRSSFGCAASSALILALGLAPSACVATVEAPPPRAVVVAGPPPAPIHEVRPPPGAPNATWVAGYWHWNGVTYAWIPGHWESAPPGERWYGPHYLRAHGHYYYQPGGWHRR